MCAGDFQGLLTIASSMMWMRSKVLLVGELRIIEVKCSMLSAGSFDKGRSG